ncbi:conserved hypothetical protein [Herbaspirillum seropedicae SmR1]|uniref:Uncharacterized protein n=2 Tax=Herbaspirillum seropedicae TaxID=964 RepID=D8IPQ3_HERSS|nr:conserved hypothetical protein [Herbaspirillum seropedicae SmR1]
MKDGTNRDAFINGDAIWEPCPFWPPDLFAVIGTIVEQSGCYTFAGPSLDDSTEHKKFLRRVKEISNEWKRDVDVPRRLQALWEKLLKKYGTYAIDGVVAHEELVRILLTMFAVADEASVGIGWEPDRSKPKSPPSVFADYAMLSLTPDSDSKVSKLPHTPYSVCAFVPPEMAVVLPKSITASVGCTVRSLSHHLALLPARSQVKPSWFMAQPYNVAQNGLRLLIIPFPFTVPDKSFRLSVDPVELTKGLHTAAFFKLKQMWLLTKDRKRISGKMLVEHLIKPLLEKARIVGDGDIDAVVMPECALSDELAYEVASALTKENLPLLITGTLKNIKGRARNSARTFSFLPGGAGGLTSIQSKHHRWRLDKSQVDRYGLSFARSSKSSKWWEDIDISERHLPFYSIGKDLSLTVLVCEDLARSDPAMPVIRAVGPNLILALLMDGPQLPLRWPGRYATVLAEDPGSSVLSITCAGMVDRSNQREHNPLRSIGLWGEAGAPMPRQLLISTSEHGLLLKLRAEATEQHTLDTRADGTVTQMLKFVSQTPLALNNPPDWL